MACAKINFWIDFYPTHLNFSNIWHFPRETFHRPITLCFPHFWSLLPKRMQALAQLNDSELDIQLYQRMHWMQVSPPKHLRKINTFIRTSHHIRHSSVLSRFYINFLENLIGWIAWYFQSFFTPHRTRNARPETDPHSELHIHVPTYMH